ncbi:MAG TPA: T9SS type A sorting domain-containing protein, partial [Rhodothermales bacterium]|nr:T9SS type A sorting domain-containing protein [Rhodothermales bacterium]
ADGAVVVGMGQSAAGTEAYRWTQATGMVGLGDFSGGSFNSEAADVSADGAVVVGRGQSASGSEAFRWTAASGLVGLGDLPGGTFSSAAAGVSADGAVVVGSGSSGGAGTEAFRWTAATGMVGLGFLPGHDRSEALGVSADGAVVVGVSSTAAERRAFVWTAATGMRDLKTALQADFGLDLTGWTLNAAYAVSDDGTIIVGSGTNTQGAELAYRAGAPFATAAEGEPGPSTGLTLSASRPSPATGDAALTLTLDAAQAVRVEVFDGLGRRVAVLHDGTLGAGAHTLWLDVAALPPGLYVARAAGADGTATRRVTVAR